MVREKAFIISVTLFCKHFQGSKSAKGRAVQTVNRHSNYLLMNTIK